MTEHPSDRAQFHAMVDGTQEDWGKIAMASAEFNRDLPNRVLAPCRPSVLHEDMKYHFQGFPAD